MLHPNPLVASFLFTVILVICGATTLGVVWLALEGLILLHNPPLGWLLAVVAIFCLLWAIVHGGTERK